MPTWEGTQQNEICLERAWRVRSRCRAAVVNGWTAEIFCKARSELRESVYITKVRAGYVIRRWRAMRMADISAENELAHGERGME